MKLSPERSEHLTYCTNIHPAESWPEVQRLFSGPIPEVKRLVCPGQKFGVGLRLSALAAQQLSGETELSRFRDLLVSQNLYVFTINGFPYGPFHGQPVKEQVYRPDWREDARLFYTDLLADILCRLLPDDMAVEGSISTVPGCFRQRALTPAHEETVARHLLAHVAKLVSLERQTGRVISLALEPEPRCMLETTEEAIRFIEEYVLSASGRSHFAALSGTQAARVEPLIRRHLGLCFDACHAAVQYENPLESIESLRRAGISVKKAQLSAGIALRSDPASMAALKPFADPVYLHQVVIRRGGELTRLLDLADAFERRGAEGSDEEWRVHFHVPIFLEKLELFASTQPFLKELLRIQRDQPFTNHLEVETYTWNVLPDQYKHSELTRAIARELEWVLNQFANA